jgi:hypothetical protein
MAVWKIAVKIQKAATKYLAQGHPLKKIITGYKFMPRTDKVSDSKMTVGKAR